MTRHGADAFSRYTKAPRVPSRTARRAVQVVKDEVHRRGREPLVPEAAHRLDDLAREEPRWVEPQHDDHGVAHVGHSLCRNDHVDGDDALRDALRNRALGRIAGSGG
jgi:hypothetical protein